MINLDLFSYSIFNSYIVFSKKDGKIHIRNIIDGDEDFSTLCTIDLKDNQIEEVKCTIGKLTLKSQLGICEITYLDLETFVIDTQFDLKLNFQPKKYEFASQISPNIWNINLYSKKSKMLITSKSPLGVSQEWNVISSDVLDLELLKGQTKVTVSSNNFADEAYHITDFDIEKYEFDIERDFCDFWNLSSLDYTRDDFESKYIIWNGFVKARGNLKYDACYMSKNIMTNIWSWDNCFVSLALAKEQPQRAYEQFMSFYHVQSEEGNLPDFMNPNYVSYDFTKPPVQGILYKELMKINYEYFTDIPRVLDVIDSFKRLINYWTNYRTFSGAHKLPYNTHGNDTGLDNATVFEDAVEIRTPDLLVYLIRLIELVNELEELIKIEVTDYSQIVDQYTDELINVMFDGTKFNSYNVHTNAINHDSKCIIELIPLLVIDKFPEEVRAQLISNIDQFLTEFGLASEAPSSKYYKADGYWRGPIWAPTTCLCYLGLEKASLGEYQERVRSSYVKMCEKYGYAENFDALEGYGLSDKSFAWTAAVYKFLKDKDE